MLKVLSQLSCEVSELVTADAVRVREVACFSIYLNLELLFCEMFDCKE